MTGTFGGALEAREIPSHPDRLEAEAEGEIESEDGVLVIKRIHVRYRLRVPDGKEDVARRAHEIHRDYCPVYRSITPSIEVTTELAEIETI
ncbi:MAG TPA: OsmC family protein [Longimicrobiales bacterium]|nr:OsmC family protein [Longimicrobiales bacterium]